MGMTSNGMTPTPVPAPLNGTGVMRIPTHLQEALKDTTGRAQIVTERAPPYKIIHVNPAWCNLTGYGANEVIGRTSGILQGPETNAKSLALLREAVAGGCQLTVELLNYTKAQRPFLNSLTVSPLFDNTGNCPYYVGILHGQEVQADPLAASVPVSQPGASTMVTAAMEAVEVPAYTATGSEAQGQNSDDSSDESSKSDMASGSGSGPPQAVKTERENGIPPGVGASAGGSAGGSGALMLGVVCEMRPFLLSASSVSRSCS